MFSSLRARLWISYAVLIVLALGVMAAALGVYLWQNPVLYRQTLTRLRTVETGILNRWGEFSGSNSISGNLERAARAFDVRILLFDQSDTLEWDTGADQPAIRLPREALLSREVLSLRDASGMAWLYTRTKLGDGRTLLIVAPRQRVTLVSFLRDELLPLFLRGGGLALLLSLVLAFGVARWIADPLQRLMSASQHIPSAETKPVPEVGPQEVRELTRAFNAMSARVQNSQRSQRDFVANVSHELKTPLTSIQGFAQAILDGTAQTPEDQQQAAGIIFQESERMYRMVLDQLDLARLDGGTADLRMSMLDLRALMNGVLEKFSLRARKLDVRLLVDSPPDLPPVHADGDRLAQVLSNLVDNALKHTPAGGQVTLQAQPSPGEIEIRVTDTGIGIPEDMLPHIFERFYQADVSRPGGEKRGAGLGLAIVKEIVAAHGGRISVRSQEGLGTTFMVWLPLARPDSSTLRQPKR
jgi:two-component system OmpR family sensor kinase